MKTTCCAAVPPLFVARKTAVCVPTCATVGVHVTTPVVLFTVIPAGA